MPFEDRTDRATKQLREELQHLPLAMAETAEAEVRKTMMAGSPSGERYPHPSSGFYVASAPGEPPAIRTGEYLRSYGTAGPIDRGSRIVAAVTSDRLVGRGKPLWAILEFGTFTQAPRPHVRPSAEAAARGFRKAAQARGGRATGTAVARRVA